MSLATPDKIRDLAHLIDSGALTVADIHEVQKAVRSRAQEEQAK